MTLCVSAPAPCLASGGIKSPLGFGVKRGVGEWATLTPGQAIRPEMRDPDPKTRRYGPASCGLMRLGRLEGRNSHKCGVNHLGCAAEGASLGDSGTRLLSPMAAR